MFGIVIKESDGEYKPFIIEKANLYTSQKNSEEKYMFDYDTRIMTSVETLEDTSLTDAKDAATLLFVSILFYIIGISLIAYFLIKMRKNQKTKK